MDTGSPICRTKAALAVVAALTALPDRVWREDGYPIKTIDVFGALLIWRFVAPASKRLGKCRFQEPRRVR